MTRIANLAVAVACYFAFFVAFCYLIGFVGNLPGWPTTVDRGADAPLGVALLTDLALIALFGVQHSVMARPGFKAKWTRAVSPVIERSIYCLAASLALAAMYLLWKPIPQIVWDVQATAPAMLLWALFALGWIIVFISTWLVSHFELFGLAQAWRNFTGAQPPVDQFRTPLFYRLVRHPIYTGFVLAMWAIPTMTLGHLVLAAGMTVYILIGISYEERDLIARFGQHYVTYRERVGMLIPGIGKKS